MSTVEYTYWRDGDTFLGFLNDHPDYWTQAGTKLELIENIKDILEDIASGEVMSGQDDMLPEYDFAGMKGGVRGKYASAYREGHTVEIRKADGTTSTQYFRLEDGAVLLEPDVREYFPDSEAVV